MHEMSLCESVRHIIEQTAQQQKFQRVTAVWLEIGALAGVEPEALRHCFDAVMQGSLAAGARLEIIDVPGVAWCDRCEQTVTIHQWYEPCPSCGHHPLALVSGDQLRIKELEVA